jgi:hypothetical protein
MLTFNSSLFNCFMRFPKENKVKVQKMSHCLTKFIRQTKRFVFIIKNPNALWGIIWRKNVMIKKRQTKLVKIKNKCLVPPWVLMIIRRMIRSSILVQHNTWHLNKSGSPLTNPLFHGRCIWEMTPFWRQMEHQGHNASWR